MNTSSTPVIPVYRALTIAGNVLERDQYGEVYHTLVMHTTLAVPAEINYKLVGGGLKKAFKK